MKIRAQQWFLCPALSWEAAYGTGQIKKLFGGWGWHRIEEGDTNTGSRDPLLLLFMDKPWK